MSGVRIVISYSHQDQSWRLRLARHLRIFELSHQIEVWSDLRIPPGERWCAEILQVIDAAQLAVLLISADSLSSDFIVNVEVPRMLKRHRNGELKIIPILVEDCPWQDVPWLAELQMRPLDAVPLAARRRHAREAELAKITREILATARMCPDPAPAAVETADEQTSTQG